MSLHANTNDVLGEFKASTRAIKNQAILTISHLVKLTQWVSMAHQIWAQWAKLAILGGLSRSSWSLFGIYLSYTCQIWYGTLDK